MENVSKLICCTSWRQFSLSKTLGLNFINIICTAFTHADLKSIKFQLSCQYLFTLLGSTCVKASGRMLMKLSLVCHELGPPIVNNCYNILIFIPIKLDKEGCRQISSLLSRDVAGTKKVRKHCSTCLGLKDLGMTTWDLIMACEGVPKCLKFCAHTYYGLCHEFRLTKQDEFIRVNSDPDVSFIFWGSWDNIINWFKPKPNLHKQVMVAQILDTEMIK